jgi:hypothetical protein
MSAYKDGMSKGVLKKSIKTMNFLCSATAFITLNRVNLAETSWVNTEGAAF